MLLGSDSPNKHLLWVSASAEEAHSRPRPLQETSRSPMGEAWVRPGAPTTLGLHPRMMPNQGGLGITEPRRDDYLGPGTEPMAGVRPRRLP
jgi:hypothetical protein